MHKPYVFNSPLPPKSSAYSHIYAPSRHSHIPASPDLHINAFAHLPIKFAHLHICIFAHQ